MFSERNPRMPLLGEKKHIAAFVSKEAMTKKGFGQKAEAVAIRAVFRFLVSSGDQVVQLQSEDIDWRSRKVFIRQGKTHAERVLWGHSVVPGGVIEPPHTAPSNPQN
jgi:hypothetical protein